MIRPTIILAGYGQELSKEEITHMVEFVHQGGIIMHMETPMTIHRQTFTLPAVYDTETRMFDLAKPKRPAHEQPRAAFQKPLLMVARKIAKGLRR